MTYSSFMMLVVSWTRKLVTCQSGMSNSRFIICRFIMPEFMPNPNYLYRDRVLEKLERRDMLRRRAVIDIPEFYVGMVSFVNLFFFFFVLARQFRRKYVT